MGIACNERKGQEERKVIMLNAENFDKIGSVLARICQGTLRSAPTPRNSALGYANACAWAPLD